MPSVITGITVRAIANGSQNRYKNVMLEYQYFSVFKNTLLETWAKLDRL
jgi:hypothetical protein